MHGVSAYRLAQVTGQSEVAALLRDAGAPAHDSPKDVFLAACARADRDSVRAMLAQDPDWIAQLSPHELRLLPELAASGQDEAVRVMVEAGWPVATRGGDINGSALNWAVFRGNAPLAAFLLAHGAHYNERHGYNDNVYGTLSFASIAETTPGGDWLACAKALVEAGSPLPETRYVFPEEIAAYFEELRRKAG
jgi:ankyrin repeat protein